MEKFTEKILLRFSETQKKKFVFVCNQEHKNTSTVIRDMCQEKINEYEKKNWKININQLNLLK